MIARPLALAALLAALASPGAAEDAAPGEAHRADVAGLLDALGYDEAFAGFAGAVAASVAACACQPEREPTFAAAAAEAFNADAMFAEAVDGVAGALVPRTLAPVVDFYESDLGLRVAASLERATTFDEEKVLAGLDRLERMREEEAPRLALYETLIDNLDAVETATATSMTVSYALTLGMMRAEAGDVAVDPAMVRAMLEGMRDGIEAQVVDPLLAAMVVTYESFETAEVERVVAITATPDYRAANRAMNEKVAAVLAARAERFGVVLARLLEERES